MRKILLTLLTSLNVALATTLQELLKIAEEKSPFLKEKKVEIFISDKDAKSKKANRYGQIKLYGSFNRYEDKRVLYPIAVPLNPNNLVGAQDQFIAGINYTVPLFLGFKTIENINISNIKSKIAKIDYKLTKNQVFFNIKTIYTKILSLNKQLKALKEHLKSLEKLKQDIQEAVKLGKKAEVDILKVNYEIEDTKFKISQLNSKILQLKEDLKFFVGQQNLDLSSLQEVNEPEVQFVPLENLNKIKKLKLLENIQKKKVKISKGNYLPEIYFLASAQRNIGASEYKDLWQIGFTANFTLFDFGKRKNEYLKSKLELSRAKIQREKETQRVKKEIKKAVEDIKTYEEKIKAYKKQLKLAKYIEEVEHLKYEEGLSTLYDLLSAKSKRLIAESYYYTAIYEKMQAKFYLQYLLEENR